jgi:hypothetical protein
MNKLNGVQRNLFFQKAILRMAATDSSAVPPNLSISGGQGALCLSTGLMLSFHYDTILAFCGT